VVVIYGADREFRRAVRQTPDNLAHRSGDGQCRVREFRVSAIQTVPKEGAGTVLDNSLVYVTSCTSWGKAHSSDDRPVLLAGKPGGALSGDQHYCSARANLSEVLMTIANIFGGKLTTFGLGAGQVTRNSPNSRRLTRAKRPAPPDPNA
jgi:hypothetical protein